MVPGWGHRGRFSGVIASGGAEVGTPGAVGLLLGISSGAGGGAEKSVGTWGRTKGARNVFSAGLEHGGSSLPGRVHPHIDRAARGPGQGLLHPGGHRREVPPPGGRHGGLHERRRRPRHARSQLRGRKRLHQGREDHPILHRRGEQDGLAEVLIRGAVGKARGAPVIGAPLLSNSVSLTRTSSKEVIILFFLCYSAMTGRMCFLSILLLS